MFTFADDAFPDKYTRMWVGLFYAPGDFYQFVDMTDISNKTIDAIFTMKDFWGPQQPNNRHIERCILLYSDGLFHDYECGSQGRTYTHLCRIVPPVATTTTGRILIVHSTF